MIQISPELATFLMLFLLLLAMALGSHIAWALAGVGILVAFLVLGTDGLSLAYMRIWSFIKQYALVAVPAFTFMGLMIERSGVADKLYDTLSDWMGGLPGGIAVATIAIGAILATTVGVVAASVAAIAIVATPAMLKRGYDRSLIAGVVCASGTLSILIPPSIMLIIYGASASLSVGNLFMGAFLPGFMLAGMYIIFTILYCWMKPSVAPPLAVQPKIPMKKKLKMLAVSLLPAVILILGVLGGIFAGVVSPTEASALGAVLSIIMALCYRSLTWKAFTRSLVETMKIMGMASAMVVGASIFVSTFLTTGGGEVVTDLILAAPFGRWGVFALIMFVLFILGMFMDFIGIVMLTVPIITPIAAQLGFDPIWFAIEACICLQLGFMTPPFAVAIFVFQGVSQPEWKIHLEDVMKGVMPFVSVALLLIITCAFFPRIITWLPSIMVKPWS